MIRAGCKINLGLRIAGRRADGYHELKTVFYPLACPFDELVFEEKESPGLEITCENMEIAMAQNTLTRAWQEFGKFRKPACGVKVTLRKGIPIGSGLGGGSSDAAAFLLWLNSRHGNILSTRQLDSCALSVGADVPFFLHSRPCYATGRGERLEPVKWLFHGFYLLLVCPEISVNTGRAFADYDAISITSKNNLTNSFDTDRDFFLSRRLFKNWLDKDGLRNDLEKAVFARFPQLAGIKEKLMKLGAVASAMSGSGSSIYGLFDNQALGKAALEKMQSLRTYFLPMRDFA